MLGNTIETYFYHGYYYTWHHEPQNEYERRHISIQEAVRVINRDDSTVEEQIEYDPPRNKFIGLSSVGIITVITDHTIQRIITAWHSSTAEINEWLRDQH